MWGFYYLKNKFTYVKAMRDILKRGGDTDTNAAIIGGLLGPASEINSIDGIPDEFCEKVLNYEGPKPPHH